MELAKPALDVGLYTNKVDDMLACWQEQAQVPYSELLKLGGGVHQHRHAIGASVLKINHIREPLASDQPCGLRKLTIFADFVDEPVDLLDPDGNELSLAPATSDSPNLCLILACNDVAAQADFYGRVLGLPRTEAGRFRVGASEIELVPGQVGPFERVATGYRYMTFQVFDVVGTHRAILTAGGREGSAPVRLGDVAYISFVLDAEGNWLEISQRKSITGSLD